MKRVFRALASTLVILLITAGLAWFIAPKLMVGANDMSQPRSEIHAAFLDGQIYTAGGIGFFRTISACDRFDPQAREWSNCPDLPRSLHHVAMAAGEGRVFASGGYASLPFNIDQDPALFALDPANEEAGWVRLTSLPTPLGQHAMLYRDGALYLIGGDDGQQTVPNLWRYTLASDQWDELDPMPTARHSHAIAVDAERLYVTGGRSAELGSQSLVIEAYTFADDRWEVLPDAPFPLGGHGAAVIAGRLHVFGGENLATAEVLTRHASLNLSVPDGGWRDEQALPAPRHGFATVAVDSTIWVLGGGKRAGMRTLWSVTGTALSVASQASSGVE